ncbi:MAG: PQQ-dependent sugar dehydrogenase [Bacteroidota bacterium]
MYYCRNCGSEVKGRFCSNCGQKRETHDFTFRVLLTNTFKTLTNMEKGFWYNLVHLTKDFRDTIWGYLDGKRIQIYNPISYAVIGVTLLLLSGEIVEDMRPDAGQVEEILKPFSSRTIGAGFEASYKFGYFLGQLSHSKYFWLFSIFVFALPASLFFRSRKYTEHLVIQAFVVGHAAFLGIVLLNLRSNFMQILSLENVVLLMLLNTWVYWKIEKDTPSWILGPVNVLVGFFLFLLFMYPISLLKEPLTKPRFSYETVISDLKHPWSITFQNDTVALITEKDGGLVQAHLNREEKTIIKNLPTDLVKDIRAKDERDNAGLFEVIIDPKFHYNRWLYLSYAAQTAEGTTTKIVRGELRNDSLVNHLTLLEVAPAQKDRFHYGGGMVWGPDDRLYISVGERFYNEIDQPALPVSQDPTDARGMIYRINPDGSIPEDNPDFGRNAVPGAYAIGIRASQGLAINPRDKMIWFTDHGSRGGDEINVLRRGANYGWPIKTTGKYRNEDYTPPEIEMDDYMPHVISWKETVAPTGLHFYQGTQIEIFRRRVLVPGLSKGSLWSLRVLNNRQLFDEINLMEDNPTRLRKVRQSPNGKLYLLTDEYEGRLIEMKYRERWYERFFD